MLKLNVTCLQGFKKAMDTILMSIFIVLHGVVHLLYFGQSQRIFELQPGMVWPEGSWAFSKLLGNERTRLLASIGCGVAALGFVTGAVGILLGQVWWRLVIVAVSAFSTVLFLLFWNGKLRKIHNQGAIGVLINIAIVGAAVLL
jgi:hypothetical protein